MVDIQPLLQFTCSVCGETDLFEPAIFYRDYSGKTPMVDLSDSQLEKEAIKHGYDFDGDDLFCQGCILDREEDEELDDSWAEQY